MNYRSLLAAVSVTGLVMLGACTTPSGGPSGSVIGVAIDQGDQTLAVGETISLTATVQSSGSVDTSLVWASDEASVASVDASGVVTAVGVGVTTVSATSVADGGVSASVDVEVLESVLEPADPFTVGIVPIVGAPNVETHVETLTNGLTATLGRPATFAAYPTMVDLLDDVLARNVEVAFLGPPAVITAIDDGDATAVLVKVRFGTIANRGEFYAQCGSGYTSPETLGGSRFGFVNPGSTIGYMVPYVTLVELGVDPDTEMTSVFAGSHDAVILGIYNDDLDAGVTFEDGVSTIAGDFPDVADVVCSIGFTPDIPNEGVVVRGGVAPSERATIVAALTSMLELPANSAAFTELSGGDASFEPAPEGIYDVFRDVVEAFF